MNDSLPIIDVLKRGYDFSIENTFIAFERSNNSIVLDKNKTAECIEKYNASGLFSNNFITQLNTFANAAELEIKNDSNIAQTANRYHYDELNLFTAGGSHPADHLNKAEFSKIEIKNDTAYAVWCFKNEDGGKFNKPSYAYLIKAEDKWQIEKLQVLEEHPLIANE